MVSGHETIISGVGGELRVRSPAGVCPRRRHLGSRVRVGADRTDLPDAPMVDFHVLTEGPSVSARTNTVQFSDISTPPDDVVTRTWDFGDPSSGTANRGSGAAVTHTYALPGSYRVSLTVADRFGQVASGSGSVDVLP
jgi:PKD repeat protein